MAQITLSGKELVCILAANGSIPPEISDIETDGESIKVRVNTPWPVVRSVRVSLRFVGFEDGHAILELTTNRFVDKFDWLIDRLLASFRMEEFAARWDYPRFYIDVNELLRRQVRGTEVTDVTFRDGRFHITTTHSNGDGVCEGDDEQAPTT